MCSLFVNMLVRRIFSNVVVKNEREGICIGDVKYLKFENEEINYDVKIKGKDICLFFF